MSLNTALPFYITRKSSSGETATWSASAWMVFLFFIVIWLNVIGWGIYSLVYLVYSIAT